MAAGTSGSDGGTLAKNYIVVPPWDATTDIFRGPAKDFFWLLCAHIAASREDQDEYLPNEAKPITKWPVKEAKLLTWNMETKSHVREVK